MPLDISGQALKRRRTKIVATLGPSSSEPAVLEGLMQSGADVFRLNFSHGTHADHAETYARVRAAAKRLGRQVCVMADLCGPKIRAGRFRGGSIPLVDGEAVTITMRDVEGEPGLIPSAYANLARDVRTGSRILLDDGNLELAVLDVEGTEVRCRVVSGGLLRDRKGINLPGVDVSAPSLTDKDREDATFALGLGADLLALSFVRRAADVAQLREVVEASGTGAGIIAKIEKPEALEQIDGIIEAADGIMVARGDLGVELPAELVPIVQSQLVDLARARAKPVIVATQMLESMVTNPRPTRAEVTDVSNAVRSGADAVMLSAETASGAHPVRAVEVLDRVARETEGYLWRRGAFGSTADVMSTPVQVPGVALPVRDAMARATGQLSRDLMVRAIVIFTRQGWSARMIASNRPQAPVLAVSDDVHSVGRMALLWGVVPLLGEIPDSPAALHEAARRLAVESGLAEPGDYVLRVGGFHADPSLHVPTVSVLRA